MLKFANAVEKEVSALRKMASGSLAIDAKSVLFLIDRIVRESEALAIAVID